MSGVICQLDIEKAYDHINWDFLNWALRQMGFGDKWCVWIKVCVSSTAFSILLNGTSFGFTKGQRGLKQGDPLSPFLFNIVMEVFSKLIARAEEVGCLNGCRLSHDGPSVVLLQFADDSLLFLPNFEEVANLRAILLMFEAMSGLKVNLPKCKMLPVCDVLDLSRLANHFGCSMVDLLGIYLGLLLGAKAKSKQLWDPMVEQVERRLASWKARYLSKVSTLC